MWQRHSMRSGSQFTCACGTVWLCHIPWASVHARSDPHWSRLILVACRYSKSGIAPPIKAKLLVIQHLLDLTACDAHPRPFSLSPRSLQPLGAVDGDCKAWFGRLLRFTWSRSVTIRNLSLRHRMGYPKTARRLEVSLQLLPQ